MISEGTKLGRYVILSPLGAGGMGEVYLAEDTRLKRSVAIKLLPANFSQNKDRLRRFEQEAQAASALNHPNIAHIYEIGEADGVNFIAMEYVDGVTLNEKIHQEKTPLGKLLKYLTQVADGLTKAHAAGIVHRDLKPDNIMISRDGYAKILDFGLAKLIEPQNPQTINADESNEAATAMMPQPLSVPGMIMGTVNYMSPEQAQGKKEIDQRSDIFSFGCVLYEAATGRQPFVGDSIVDTLHKIIHTPAPPIRDFNANAPNDLQRIVRRCLAKDSEERYQTIKDVAIELKELRREMTNDAELHQSVSSQNVSNASDTHAPTLLTSSAEQTVETKESSAARSTSSAEYLTGEIKRHKKLVGVVALALLLAMGGIGFGLYKFWGKADKPPQAIKVERLTTNGKSVNVAISPDGKYVVYTVDEGGGHSLWVRQVTASSNIQIIPPAEDVYYWGLTFTPDSNYINFAKVQFEKNVDWVLYQMPVLGGTQKKLITHAQGGVSYSPDGKQFAFVREEYPSAEESSLLIANSDGTGERILASRKAPERFPSRERSPAWSPDGKTIACIVETATGVGRADVVEVNVADGTSKTVVTKEWEEINQIAWLPDKSGLLVLGVEKGSVNYSGQIWRFSYPEGEARRITTDFNNYASMSLTADSGALVTVQSNRISNIWVAANGDAGRAVQIKSGGNNLEGIEGIAWTPDGRVVYDSLASGAIDIWIMNADGTGQKQLTVVDAGANFRAKVTPDGRYIVFVSIRNDQANIWRMNLDGSNRQQLTNGNSVWDPAVTPDSRWVIYTAQRSGMPYLWKVSIDGGDAVQLTDKYTNSPEVSPDGKWIVCSYRKDVNSTWRYAIIPYEGGEPIKVFDLLGKKGNFRWSPDGRSLYYLRDTSGGVTNVWSFPLDNKPPKQLTDFKTEQIYNFAWSPDGKQLVLARGTTTSDVLLIKDFR
jgi:serine/threonine protein kinase